MSKYEIKKKGITLKIDVDSSYTHVNPRIGENVGRLICWHGKYKLGDEHHFVDPTYFKEYVEDKDNEVYCILDVYLYDHSGLVLSTTPFNDEFDSGQVGYIYCTVQDLKDFGLSLDDKEKVITELKNEIVEYNNYLSDADEYYDYKITDEDDYVVDYMTGFVNDNKIKMFKEMQQCASEKYQYLFRELISKELNRESCL